MDNIGKRLETYLPRELLVLVKAAGELASARGQGLYLVGGAVRDLLLGRRSLDLDLVVEGDALSLTRQLAKFKGGEVVTHPRFGTATFWQGEISLDLVTARSETYARPGVLPIVKTGKIDDDLFRRDFTINAMAVSLDPARFGELVDPYDGKSDLDRGLIRVLNKGSFNDDPTRIWRAIRYEQRLGFKLEPKTERLLRLGLAIMDKVSGERLRHELERILEENYPERAFGRAEELGALKKLHPSLEGNGWLARCCRQVREMSGGLKPEANLYLALLAWRLGEEELKAFMERLRFGGEAARVLRDVPGLKQTLPKLAAPVLQPSAIYHMLERYRLQAIAAAALAADSTLVRQRLELYLSSLRCVLPFLSGDDLKRMGVPPGRKLGSLLRALKDARLDGKVTTREGEQELVRRWLTEGER